ncbi:MAG: glycoside hydrolase family 99-like domain-containing protein [Planctomycetota bacterium]
MRLMRAHRCLVFLFVAALFLSLISCGKDEKPKDVQPAGPILLGAYYNPWFGADAGQWANYLRKKLTIQQAPVLGEYNCQDIPTIKKHLDWARDADIDFFAMDWCGPNTWTDTAIKQQWAPYLAKTQSKFRFCISYQTLFILNNSGGGIPITRDSTKQLLDQFTYLATEYFGNPNYLKIDGRPVVFMKYSRMLAGDYEKALARVKTIIKHQKGFNIFLVGDEVWWKGITPQRIKSFDAITAYSLQGPLQYDGMPLLTGFFTDAEKQFDAYKTEAAKSNVRFIPSVMPGYNDRGVQSDVPHAILSRDATMDKENEGTTYRLYFRLAKKYLDTPLNMLMITSFNGWAEDTQIEPCTSSFLTPAKHPVELTGGYNYYGYNDQYLKITKDEKAIETKK